MFRSNKIVLFIVTSLAILALSACTLGQSDQPTPTPFDVNAVQTSAAATAHVQLTQIAAAVAATATPAPPSTDTPASAATDTPGAPTDTLAPGAPTPTPTATPMVIGTPGTATITPIPSFTLAPTTGPVGGPVCKNSAFNGDITIPDGTVMKPWQKFQKVWKVKNTGTCTWDQGFSFNPVEGPPSMATHLSPYYFQTKSNFVAAGESVDIAINMYAPGDPGQYVAHWHMYDDNGKPFGSDFTVVIQVVK